MQREKPRDGMRGAVALIPLVLSLAFFLGCPFGPTSGNVDVTAPLPGGSGIITISALTTDSVTLQWEPASDETSLVSGISYRLYYSTDLLDLTTPDIAMLSGTSAGNWQNQLASIMIQNLQPETTYYFRLLIRDSEGNTAMYEVATGTTHILITDTTPPTITLPGETSITLTVDSTFDLLEGVTANDNIDGDVSSLITVSGTLNTAVTGTYTLTYTVTDSAGNTATPVILTITVTPQDVTKPEITLIGEAEMTIDLNSTFTDPGTLVTDDVDSGLTATASGTVDTTTEGTYTITYTASDAAGNAADPVTRTVHVVIPDTEAPVITLNGNSEITLIVGETFTDPGVTITDDRDSGLIPSITGTINPSIPGTYTLTYNVSDTAGNAAVPVSRTVTVLPQDTDAPVITLSGAFEIYINQGVTYTEPGFSAEDDRDGDIASEVTVSGTVDTSVTGITILSYDVSDAAGNTAETVTRRIIVLTADTVAPELTLLGSPLIYITLGSSFTDPGAEAWDNYGFEDLTDQITVAGTVSTGTAGTYTLSYSVSDASDNAAVPVERTVIVVPVSANVAPVIDAGENFTGDPGSYTLSAAGSYDVNGDSLDYEWQLDSSPGGSSGYLNSDCTFSYDFDTAGTYVFSLMISDGVEDEATTVTYVINNVAPIIMYVVSYSIPLDLEENSSANIYCNTHDANGDMPNFLWEIVSYPAGSSTAGLTNETSPTPTFTPDVPGSYVIRLTVDDGELSDYKELVFDVYDSSLGGIYVEIQ